MAVSGYNRKIVDNNGKSDIIKESSKKNIMPITDKAIESVPKVDISGFTDEQNAFIQQQHSELLRYARDNNDSKEIAFVFKKGLTERSEYIGTDSEIEFGTSLLGKGNELFVMHNHPRNSSFSDVDIALLLSNDNINTLSIVKNNGNIEAITKTETYDKLAITNNFKRQYKKYVKTGNDDEIDIAIRKFIDKNKEMIAWNKSL